MTRKEKAGFGKGKASPSGEAINPRISEALQSRANESGLACAAAFAVAAEIGVSPKAVGEAMDQLQIPIIKCQLGLFGYAPKKKIVEPAKTVTADEEKAVRQALVNGKLPCASAGNWPPRSERPGWRWPPYAKGSPSKSAPASLGPSDRQRA